MNNELAKAVADYRRKNGAEALRDLIATHGGEGGYGSVPAENLAAFAKELGVDLAERRKESNTTPPAMRTIPEIRAALNDMNESAFARFNSTTPRRYDFPKIG